MKIATAGRLATTILGVTVLAACSSGGSSSSESASASANASASTQAVPTPSFSAGTPAYCGILFGAITGSQAEAPAQITAASEAAKSAGLTQTADDLAVFAAAVGSTASPTAEQQAANKVVAARLQTDVTAACGYDPANPTGPATSASPAPAAS